MGIEGSHAQDHTNPVPGNRLFGVLAHRMKKPRFKPVFALFVLFFPA